ncbi:hypothetical protein L0156_19930 [bacterium]|nr:hypothetical protein [bacterium]
MIRPNSLKARTQALSDFFRYVFAYAPEFPAEDEMDLLKSFEQIKTDFDYLFRQFKGRENVQFLNLAYNETEEAYQLYFSGQDKGARKRLRSAIDHFDSFIKGKKATARFAIDPEGNVGEFSKNKGN